MAKAGNLLTKPIGRALFAVCVDLPYTLEKPLMRRLLKTPVFEPVTPTQLSVIAAFPSRPAATGADGMPSIMAPSMAEFICSNDTRGGPAFGDMAAVLSPAAVGLSAVHSEL